VYSPSPVDEERVNHYPKKGEDSLHRPDGDDGQEDSLGQEDGLEAARVNEAEGDYRYGQYLSVRRAQEDASHTAAARR